MQNITGSPVDGENFHGREHELGVLRRLVSPAFNDVLLLSPRRVGKSSLTLETIRLLRDEGWLCIYCDVQNVVDEGHFLDELRRSLDSAKVDKRLSRKTADAVGAYREIMRGITLQAAGVEVSLDDSGKQVDWQAASDAVEALLEGLSKMEPSVLLVVDELPIFLSKLIRQDRSETAIDVLNWLCKARRATDKGLAWVFAGSIGLDSQVEHLGVAGSIGDLKIERLGAMSVSETKGLLYKLASNPERSLEINEEVIERIIEKVGWLIPSYVQLVYHALSELHPDERCSSYPCSEDVDRAYGNLMEAHYASKFAPWDGRLDEPFIDPRDAKRARFILGRICRKPQGVPRDQLYQECLAKEPNTEEDELKRSLSRVFLLLERDGYLADANGSTVAFRSPLLRDYWNRRH